MSQFSSLARTRFFQERVHHPKWKESMAGNNEKPVIKILSAIGYEDEIDYKRQHPIGEKFVIDFAFVNEQIALEVDGIGHDSGKQRILDLKRDSYLRHNNWVALRIKDRDMLNLYRQSFFKSLIKEVVEERRAQYQQGMLYHIDIPNYNEIDYE